MVSETQQNNETSVYIYGTERNETYNGWVYYTMNRDGEYVGYFSLEDGGYRVPGMGFYPTFDAARDALVRWDEHFQLGTLSWGGLKAHTNND